MDWKTQIPALPGIDWTRGLSYTGGNRTLYLRFLKRFPEDKNMDRLMRALSSGDLETAFTCAHTLKGLALQLGIAALSEPASTLCDLLRLRDPSLLPQANALASRLYARYEQVIQALRNL